MWHVVYCDNSVRAYIGGNNSVGIGERHSVYPIACNPVAPSAHLIHLYIQSVDMSGDNISWLIPKTGPVPSIIARPFGEHHVCLAGSVG